MESFLIWVGIFIGDIISIGGGVYCGYKFFYALMQGFDVGRYKRYLIAAFFLVLVIPPIFTMTSLKIFSSGFTTPTFGVMLEGSSNDVQVLQSKGNTVFLLRNSWEYDKELVVSVSCQGDRQVCNAPKSMVEVENKYVDVPRKEVVQLPIRINVKDGVGVGEYRFNITLSSRKGEKQMDIPVSIIVK